MAKGVEASQADPSAAAHYLFRSICVYMEDDPSDAPLAIEDFLGKRGHGARAAARGCFSA